MDPLQVLHKFKLLFDKIKEPGYVMDSYYADGLINALTTEVEGGLSTKVLCQLADHVMGALDYTEQQNLTVRVFLIRLLALIAQREVSFSKVFMRKAESIAKGFIEMKAPNTPSSLRVAYMEVALAVVSHDSGVFWILETGIWKEIIGYVYEKQTVFLVRQTYKFASKLIWRLNDAGDEDNIRSIYDHIFKPMKELDLIKVVDITVEEEAIMSRDIEPMLQILVAIITEPGRVHKPNFAISVLTNEYHPATYYYCMLNKFHREPFILLLCRLLFWQQCAKMFVTKPLTPDTVYQTEDFNEITAMYFNTLQILVQRRSVTAILDFCNECHVIWVKITGDEMITPIQNMKHFHNQLLSVALVPLLVFIKKLNYKDTSVQARLNSYATSMLNNACEHIARAAYTLRDLFEELGPTSVAIQSVKRMTCLKNHLNNEQANIVFRPLFFFLTQYVPKNNALGAHDYGDGQDNVLVMSYVLDTLFYLINNHNINWQESLEVLCLYNVVYNILYFRQNLSSKFVVLGLDVLKSTVKKFLPPNLSLLLESKPGTQIDDLGKLIYVKMHDLHWEVRDSALELLFVMTEISYIKFPPFQKQIMQNKLINTAATIAFHDHEYYVQASALKCLAAAIRIGPIWEQLISEYSDIQSRLISILLNNPEGIVRKEACNVLCDIYLNLKVAPCFKTSLYEHMVSSALNDFHWEVQLSALRFWKIVIEGFLNDQGMLDGTFPPVTFSRETRKIVTLNETEIQKRLLRVLDELSAIGCLTVLVKMLNVDGDVEIIDATYSTAMDFISVLNKYKVSDVIKPRENEISLDDLLGEQKMENPDMEMADAVNFEKSDSVIESILNSDDINLLANIYDKKMHLESNSEVPVIIPNVKPNATPYLFINHLKNFDFKAIVDSKRKWKEGITSVSSLLDDMLGIYEIRDEINTLDCY